MVSEIPSPRAIAYLFYGVLEIKKLYLFLSLRSEIQLLWAKVGTETNFMFMYQSIRNFNFLPHGYLNSFKFLSWSQNYVQMPYPGSFF